MNPSHDCGVNRGRAEVASACHSEQAKRAVWGKLEAFRPDRRKPEATSQPPRQLMKLLEQTDG
jgi:hypothetical protein